MLASAPAWALYKVVGPDGRVTYTDRPPSVAQGNAVPMGQGPRAGAEVTLPHELREATRRFPVVLFTVPDCPVCDQARDLLRKRGVPHSERSASTNAEREAWPRIVGSPDAPALTVGQQALHGLNSVEWQRTLDVAGYPRQSRLPPNFAYSPSTALVPGSSDATSAAPGMITVTPPAQASQHPAAPTPPPPTEPAIRF